MSLSLKDLSPFHVFERLFYLNEDKKVNKKTLGLKLFVFTSNDI